MKKKHLKSLESLSKWFAQKGVSNDSVRNALTTLKKVIQEQSEDEESGDGALPLPKEIQNDPAALALYTDGGCRGNPGPGAFAFLIQNSQGDVVLEGVEFEAHTTNNKMELSGAIEGLDRLRTKLPSSVATKIKVVTDSKYVVEGMKSWVDGWKSRGWKKADNKPPENIELWQRLDSVRSHYQQIEWVWVKGHAGHPQNEYCDRKANEVMDENSSLA